MSMIRCKGCGALYHYEKEGCCPKCGAYNRPPVREKIDADGTVRHMTDDAFARHGGGGNKVCFETKECHERKECYEEQGRQYRTAKTGAAQSGTWKTAAPTPAQTAAPQRGKKKKPLSLGTVILVIVTVIAVTNVLREMADSDNPYTDLTEWEAEYATELPYSQWEAADCAIKVAMGESISLDDGTALKVTGVEWDRQQSAYTILTERTYPDDMTEQEQAAADARLYPKGLHCQRMETFLVLGCQSFAGDRCVFPTDDPLLLPGHIVFYYKSPVNGVSQHIRVTLTVENPD